MPGSWPRLRLVLAILGALPALPAVAIDESEGFAQIGEPCDSAKTVPSINTHRKETKALFEKLGEADGAIIKYRQTCHAWMQNPEQTDKAQALAAERNAAMAKVGEFKAAVASWGSKNQKYTKGMEKLVHRSCHKDLSFLQGYYTQRAPDELAKRMRAACTSDKENKLDPATSVNRAREAGTDIAGSNAADAARIEETLTNPRKNQASRRHSAELLDRAEAAANELGLETPRAGRNDRICGEACAAVLRAQAACSANQYSSECANAKDAARATRKGIYGTVYR